MVRRWGALVAERAWTVLVAGLLVVVGAGVYGAGVFGSLSQGGFEDPDTESARELALEQEVFGNKQIDLVAIYGHDELVAGDPEFRAEVRRTLAALPEGTTASVVPYYAAPDAGLVSDDGHAAQVLISLAGDDQDEFATSYDRLRPHLDADGLRTDVAGSWAVYGDVNKIVSEDLKTAEMVSLPIVLLLSLLIFGSVVAASMPVLVGALSVVGALAVVRLITEFVEVSVFSVNIITLLGMGLAVDYALFMVSRFREELAALPADHPDAADSALRSTMATAGRTVLFSGVTVAAALASLLVFPQAFLRSMGYGGVAAVVVAMLAALTVLPAVLRLLGRRIDSGRLSVRALRRHQSVDTTAVSDDHGAWARLAHSVMGRPVLYLVATTAVLLAIASPFLGVKWGSVDYRVLPEDAPAHEAAELLNTEFGGVEVSEANVLLTGAEQGDLASYTRSVEQVDGVLRVLPVDQSDSTTLLRVAWEGNSQSEASQEMVRELRAVPTPDGTEALVGGLAANTVDLLDSIESHLPWMALIVVGVMLVLLFLAFGSVVLPVKAVLMNALSITASFGVVTWIFADGHLEGLLGFESPGYLDATQPILMLAILFGLSMDYEVFLLSRVREQWDRTRDNTLAVATGVQKTGRIITSAALLLAVVIGAFGASGIVFMKMVGVGMLVALLLDATIVRALLVPATMKLLGSWNWWAPGPLARWWERHGISEAGPRPDPTPDDRVPALVP